MEKSNLADLAQLVMTDGAPHAAILTPEVRSGASLTCVFRGGSDDMPAFLVVWFYTVSVRNRAAFSAKVGCL